MYDDYDVLEMHSLELTLSLHVCVVTGGRKRIMKDPLLYLHYGMGHMFTYTPS